MILQGSFEILAKILSVFGTVFRTAMIPLTFAMLSPLKIIRRRSILVSFRQFLAFSKRNSFLIKCHRTVLFILLVTSTTNVVSLSSYSGANNLLRFFGILFATKAATATSGLIIFGLVFVWFRDHGHMQVQGSHPQSKDRHDQTHGQCHVIVDAGKGLPRTHLLASHTFGGVAQSFGMSKAAVATKQPPHYEIPARLL